MDCIGRAPDGRRGRPFARRVARHGARFDRGGGEPARRDIRRHDPARELHLPAQHAGCRCICQDVLLKALNRAERFESAEHERAWIIRVAINAAKDLLRRQSGRATVALDDIAELVAPARATEHELEARSESVLERVMALPLEYREAIYLHYYEGYSIKQIAAIVHASESAVATRLSRGRSKLRPALEGVRHELDL